MPAPDAVVMTVLGPIDVTELGVTQPHEHVLVDLFDMKGSYDTILDDVPLAVEEVARFAAAGGRTIVDTTNSGIGRDPAGLAAVSRATGVNIVMGTGWYRETVYSRLVIESPARVLAEILIAEIEEGADGTGIRPGVIGELGTERYHITALQERVFRAAAIAGMATDTTITTHTSHYGDLALDQVALLRGEGVRPERIVIGHQGDHRDLEREMPVLETGVFVEIDHVGFVDYQTDTRRADHVAEIVRAGFTDQLLISSDLCMRTQLHAFGGHGYDHLITTFLPLLRERGVSDADIRRITVDNPARALGRASAT
jgi:predicted metal-dependent phosphotriesterase family hydrolase